MTKARASDIGRTASRPVTAVELDLRDQLAGVKAENRRLQSEIEALRLELGEQAQSAALDRLRLDLERSEANRLQAVHELEARIAELMTEQIEILDSHSEEMSVLANRIRSTVTWRAGRIVTLPLVALSGLRRKLLRRG